MDNKIPHRFEDSGRLISLSWIDIEKAVGSQNSNGYLTTSQNSPVPQRQERQQNETEPKRNTEVGSKNKKDLKP